MSDAPDFQCAAEVFDCADPEAREAGIAAVREALSQGSSVVLPTDTVYGIGADAFSATAVQGLLDAKGRGRDMPPPVLIADPAVMMALGRDIPEAAKKIAERFWPGALTLILHAQKSLQMDLGETQGTIAVRVPDHQLARELLRATGPMAVSSANRTGQPAATTAAEAVEQLGDRVAVILDDGSTPGSQPSTIIDFTRTDYGAVVRHGALSVDELREVLPFLDDRSGAEHEDEDAQAEPEKAGTESEHEDSQAETEEPKTEHTGAHLAEAPAAHEEVQTAAEAGVPAAHEEVQAASDKETPAEADPTAPENHPIPFGADEEARRLEQSRTDPTSHDPGASS